MAHVKMIYDEYIPCNGDFPVRFVMLIARKQKHAQKTDNRHKRLVIAYCHLQPPKVPSLRSLKVAFVPDQHKSTRIFTSFSGYSIDFNICSDMI